MREEEGSRGTKSGQQEGVGGKGSSSVHFPFSQTNARIHAPARFLPVGEATEELDRTVRVCAELAVFVD